jgi:hypothetical protein
MAGAVRESVQLRSASRYIRAAFRGKASARPRDLVLAHLRADDLE